MENVLSEPYEIGLKNLQVFYDPELLMYDWHDSNNQEKLFKKTLITAATIAVLHSNINAKNIVVLNNEINAERIEYVLNEVEETEKTVMEALTLVSIRNREIFFTEDEICEMEILDAYHDQTKKYFTSKKKISF